VRGAPHLPRKEQLRTTKLSTSCKPAKLKDFCSTTTPQGTNWVAKLPDIACHMAISTHAWAFAAAIFLRFQVRNTGNSDMVLHTI
jgi:hypothetical protein